MPPEPPALLMDSHMPSPPSSGTTEVLANIRHCQKLILNLKSERFLREFKQKTAAGPSDLGVGVTEVNMATIGKLYNTLLPLLNQLSRGLNPVFLIISVLPSEDSSLSTAANIDPQVRSLIKRNVAQFKKLLLRLNANLSNRIGLTDAEKLRRKVSGPLWHDRSLDDHIRELKGFWEHFETFWDVLSMENRFVVKKLEQYHEKAGHYMEMFRWARKQTQPPHPHEGNSQPNEVKFTTEGQDDEPKRYPLEPKPRGRVPFSGNNFYQEVDLPFPHLAEDHVAPAPETMRILKRLTTAQFTKDPIVSLPKFSGLASAADSKDSKDSKEIWIFELPFDTRSEPTEHGAYPNCPTLHSILTVDSNLIRPSPPAERVKMALELAKAVFVLNSGGLVHKNIWPGSIFLKPTGLTSASVTRDSHRQNPLFGEQLQQYKSLPKKQLPMPVLAGFTESRSVGFGSYGLSPSDKYWEKLYIHHTRYREDPNKDKAKRRFTILDDAYAFGVILIEIALWETLVAKGIDHTYDVIPRYLQPNLSYCGVEEIVNGQVVWVYPLLRLARGRVRMILGETYAGVVEWCLSCIDYATTFGGGPTTGYSMHEGDARAIDPDERLAGEFVRNVLLPLKSIAM